MIHTTKIYLVTNCYGDPNKVYIGKTTHSRKSKHKKTYGKDIIYDYIDKIKSLNKKDWKPLEGFWIQYFKFLGFEVLNKNEIGGGGPSFYSEESKIKMGLSKKGKPIHSDSWKKIMSKRLKGIKFSQEQKLKITKAKLGSKLPTLQKAVEQYNKQGELIAIYNSISDANILIGKDRNAGPIGKCCKGKLKTAYGYKWKWKK